MRLGQEGQSLLLACVFLLILGGALVHLFNSGRLLAERVRLTTAADQVAHAVGVGEARLLNLNAYINRAAIANQLAVAQELSLASWAEFTQPLPETTAPLLVPPLTPVGAPVNQGSRLLAAGMQPVPDLMGAFIAQNEAANVLLAGHQRAMNTAYWPIMARDLPRQVLQLSGMAAEGVEARYVATTTVPTDALQHVTGNDRNRLAPVLLDSRDDFTRARKRWDTVLPVLLHKCDKLTPDVPVFEFRKRGGTDLVGLDEWKAIDTFSLHTFVGYWKWKRFSLRWICSESEYPVGFGSAAVSHGDGDGDARRAQDFDAAWALNPVAANAGQNNRPRYDVRDGIRFPAPAVPEFYDLNARLRGQAAPSLAVVIRLSHPAARLPVTDRASAFKVGRTVDMPLAASVSSFAALSRAEVYFQRPADAWLNRGKAEAPSLFNPYWRVRMAEPNAADRQAPVLPW